MSAATGLTRLRPELIPDWLEYAARTGLNLHGNGRERRTACGIHGGERDSFAVNVETGAWTCHACGAAGRDPLDYHRAVTGTSFAEAAQDLGAWCEAGAAPALPPRARPAPPARPRQRETLSDYGRELWACCEPVSGPARAYLERRNCAIPPADGDLRWHPALKHPSGHVGPALVALVTDARDAGRALTLHRTWLCADGTKAAVDPPRMLLVGHRKAGGVVRLWPDEAVTQGLGIAEGIETALSLAHAYRPVWAAIDAGNLGTLPVLAGIEALVIGVDADPAGRAAARACSDRWAEDGRQVFLVEPSAGDLNDLAAEGATP
jgi:phage/plasmid primase-like uncharacterized protein